MIHVVQALSCAVFQKRIPDSNSFLAFLKFCEGHSQSFSEIPPRLSFPPLLHVPVPGLLRSDSCKTPP